MLLNINLQLWKKTKQFTDLFLENFREIRKFLSAYMSKVVKMTANFGSLLIFNASQALWCFIVRQYGANYHTLKSLFSDKRGKIKINEGRRLINFNSLATQMDIWGHKKHFPTSNVILNFNFKENYHLKS